jgi:hypothetical protein
MGLTCVQIRTVLWIALLSVISSFCSSQTHNVVCRDGYGKFEGKFATGVTVSVGAAKNGQLAKRVCEARLGWGKEDLLVEPEAPQVDIDLLGADLGLGTPVVAFEMKESNADWSMKYQIYSLQKPPRLLRTIAGGDFFSAADTDLDGRIEIWTGDAQAVNGFENLSLGEFDFAPTVVMRFEDHRLMDVSSEFRSHFDQQIAEVRAHLDSQELSDFKNSDGKLPTMSPLPVEQLHRLRIAKIKVLEIVWAYLYSGREQDAWHALAEMWPAADLDRIHASIVSARARGVLGQVDGVSPGASHFRLKKSAYIYETVGNAEEGSSDKSAVSLTADTKPQPILLRRPLPPGFQEAVPKAEESVDLVIDVAGKVRSAKAVGGADADLTSAAAEWKFIPAFRDGRAVASRLRLAVTLLR